MRRIDLRSIGAGVTSATRAVVACSDTVSQSAFPQRHVLVLGSSTVLRPQAYTNYYSFHLGSFIVLTVLRQLGEATVFSIKAMAAPQASGVIPMQLLTLHEVRDHSYPVHSALFSLATTARFLLDSARARYDLTRPSLNPC